MSTVQEFNGAIKVNGTVSATGVGVTNGIFAPIIQIIKNGMVGVRIDGNVITADRIEASLKIISPNFEGKATDAVHADQADSATNADHATAADSATNADHATAADSATTANNAKEVDKDFLLEAIYPVGSIYLSVNNVNPSTFIGGTWVTWGTGRVPVGVDSTQSEFNAVEKSGGEKTHLLTVAEIPSHNHSLPITSISGASNVTMNNVSFGDTRDPNKEMLYSQDTGGGSAHNNLQPYITCYMWKRTA